MKRAQYFPTLVAISQIPIYGKEIDIFLPDHSIGIEYDGLRWHAKTIDRDRKQFHDLAKKISN